jgi:hypothetical protein
VQQVINISGALLNSYQSGGNYPCLSTAFNDLTDETLLPNQLVVHPNPSHGKIHLTWNNIQAEHLEIRTMHGALVYAESIENMSATDIDISELPRGIYFIQIGTHMQRVILD